MFYWSSKYWIHYINVGLFIIYNLILLLDYSHIFLFCNSIERHNIHFIVFLSDSLGWFGKHCCCQPVKPIEMLHVILSNTNKLDLHTQQMIKLPFLCYGAAFTQTTKTALHHMLFMTPHSLSAKPPI